MTNSLPNVVGLFDTHLHFFDERYQQTANWNIAQTIMQAKEHQVTFFCNVGTNLATSKEALVIARRYPAVVAACGFHPTMVNQWNAESHQALLHLLQDPKVVAIGEIGLDFYHHYTAPALQKQIFIQQLLLAQQTQKPVLLHIRQAYSEVLEIIKKYPVRGIVHCFSGTLAEAKAFIQLGFFISFSGVLTFPNATSLQTIAKQLPLSKIVLETDAPYLTPVPFRGKLNLPQYLLWTAKKLASLKNLSLQEVITQTTRNAFAVFGIITPS